jgi:cell division protein FtsZ
VARPVAALVAAADTVFVVPRDRRYRPEELLGFAVRGITDLLTVPGMVCFDLCDVECMTKGRGAGAIGLGWAWGAGRARRAARAALASPLLHGVDLAGVRTGIVNITGGWDFHLAECQAVVQEVHTVLGQEASWVCGCVIDGQLDGGCRVTVLATGVPAAPRGRARRTGGARRDTRRTGGSKVRT